jgi:hypothetical protein
MVRAEKAIMEEEGKGAGGKPVGVRKPKNVVAEKPAVKPAPRTEEGDRPARRRAPFKQKVAKKRRVGGTGGDHDDHPPNDVIERDLLGFCCKTCQCPEDKEDYMPPADDGGVHRYVQPCEGALYHRTCCHGIQQLPGEDYATLYEAARERIGFDEYNVHDDEDNDYDEYSNVRWVTKKEIYESYKTAKSQESTLYNADGDDHPKSRLFTNEDYLPGVVKPYEALCKIAQETEDSNRPRAVVLDAFAGVGTGIVVLKRLGIDIAKVIHVEHDKVATHVYRWNHDPTYNPDLPEDGIQHVFVDAWKAFEENWESLCDEHGRKFDCHSKDC